MTQFEFITVAVSMVLSLALVRLVEGGVSALRPSRLYPIHAIWIGIGILRIFLNWWMLWGNREVSSWTFPLFLLQSVPAGVLYAHAIILVTSTPRSVTSWRDHYYQSAPVFFGLNIVFYCSVPLWRWLSVGFGSGDLLGYLPVLVGIAFSTIVMASKNPRVHMVYVLYEVPHYCWLAGVQAYETM
jgi:hypothetical protein